MKILLTGANGLIGTRLLELMKGHRLFGSDTADFDITDLEATVAYIKSKQPDVIIHLAAYTNTEKAEEEREFAWEVNVTGTENLLKAAAELDKVQFIYFSTDHTFDGKKGNYIETDIQNPVNYYGETKLAGEQLVTQLPNSLILRISYPFRSHFEPKSDIVRWMLPRLENKETLHLVSDQFITPTFIDDLAVVLDKVISLQIAGVYHSSGETCLSFVDLGKMVAHEFGYDPQLIQPITLNEFMKKMNRKAGQPLNGGLISTKLKNEIGFAPRAFPDALKIMKEQMK
jgi:dTDP-4-dehydrorhamnose reductase